MEPSPVAHTSEKAKQDIEMESSSDTYVNTSEKIDQKDVIESPSDVHVDIPELAKGKDTEDGDDYQGGGLGAYLKIFHYADRLDWVLNTLAFLSAVASGATMPLMAIIFGGFTTKFNNFSTGAETPDQFRHDANKYTLWFIYLFIGRFVLMYIGNLCITISAMRTTRAIRQAFLGHLLRLEIWHFDGADNGAAATQVTTNGNRINSGIAEKLLLVVQALSMFFTGFIISLAVQWKLALITMSIIPVIFGVMIPCIGLEVAYEAKVMNSYSQGAAFAQEAISSIKTVHAFWAQGKMAGKYHVYLQKAFEQGMKKSLNLGVLFSVEYFCVYSGIALCFWQGYHMFLRGEIQEVGTVFTVEMAVLLAATSMSTLAPHITTITNAAAAASELFAIMEKKSSLDPLDPSGNQPETCVGHLQFENVDFAYPSRPSAQVLNKFSIDIPAGKTTALVGASGSGKSTTVGLLERWYVPISGNILLDGVNISEYNTKWLRSNMRLVQQEPVLFQGSVFQNVAKGFLPKQRQLPEEEQRRLVKEACISSNANDFIEELPQGYDTEVGERAGMLSGGQKQRIAIARSIISNPKILLLDEATSALDPRAEKIVQDALDQVSKNRTTLVIAHRLSTIKKADNIAVMSNGSLVEQGTHDELISRGGHYAALVRAQQLGIGEESKKDADRSVDIEKDGQVTSIARTTTAQSVPGKVIGEQVELTGTVGYSLIRCIFIMFLEQKDLYAGIVLSIICCGIGAATYPAQAVIFSQVIDVFKYTGKAAEDRANFWALMFFVVALGNLISYFVIGWYCNVIGQYVTRRYRLEMFERILNQDIRFYDQAENSSGALTSKLTSLPTHLHELLAINVFLILIIIFNITTSSILALAYGWKLSLVVIFGGLVPLVFAGYSRIRLETKLNVKNEERFSESAGLAGETVSAIRTIASLTLETEILEEFSSKLGTIVRSSVSSLLFSMVPYCLSQSLDFLVMALGFWYGSRLLASGEYSTKQFYIIFIGVLYAGQAAGQFFGWSTSFTNAAHAANYILWLRTLTPVVREDEHNKDIGPDGDASISLEQIDFAYPGRDSRVIKNVSMTIESGQFVAFVGASGCGKSTLISLLERYYDPISGRICFGDRDISKMSPRLYRSHISLVQQEPTLYQGSVRENILLGFEDEPTDAQIWEACRQANALDFVQSLPEGFETSCGSRGMQFSGGQRQRIAIARALIKNPRLLLLDEATSALDTQSERLVQAALDEAAKSASRTTVAVAHRLSTIRAANMIFLFADGRIAEMGTHEELQQQRGRYYEMCLAQSLDRSV